MAYTIGGPAGNRLIVVRAIVYLIQPFQIYV